MVRGNKTDRKNGEHVENILQKIAYHNDKKSGGALFLPSYDLPASERRHFIFDFISLNIEALEISDKLRLVIDVEKYIFRRAIYNANDIINIPPELSGSISDLVQPSNLKKLKVLQKLMICIIDKFRPIFEGNECFLELPTVNISFSASWAERTYGKVICIESSPEGDDYNLAYYELINLLNEIPIDNIKKCSVCGRIFYHDRKGGLYCSERCRWKLSSKKYREKNPEAYKESQRRIMQEKYDKAIEKKHGSGKLRKLQKNRKEKGKNIVG